MDLSASLAAAQSERDISALLRAALLFSRSRLALAACGRASNGTAGLVSCSVALALIVADARQLGLQSAVEPFCLLLVKVLAAQCVPVQLAALEAARPVSGWRGLFEVRSGSREKGRRLELVSG